MYLVKIVFRETGEKPFRRADASSAAAAAADVTLSYNMKKTGQKYNIKKYKTKTHRTSETVQKKRAPGTQQNTKAQAVPEQNHKIKSQNKKTQNRALFNRTVVSG